MDIAKQLSMKFENIEDLKIGGIYPFYGTITSIKDEVDGIVKAATLNENITLMFNITSIDNSNTLKNRLFEYGIFVGQLISKGENNTIVVDCSTVVFGKKAESTLVEQ
jgi:hypothetical protein